MKKINFIKITSLLVCFTLLTSCILPTRPTNKYKYEFLIYGDDYIETVCYTDSIKVLPNGVLYYSVGMYDSSRTYLNNRLYSVGQYTNMEYKVNVLR